MPGTGHSHRFKSSISNRNTKPAFQVLAPWNSRKNGEKNQVAVSTGGDDLNFKLMGAKMMSNYKKTIDAWELDCSLVVLGNKIVDGTVTIVGDVDISGHVTIHGDLSGNDASFNNVDICGNLLVKDDATFYKDVDICGNLTIKGHTEGSTAYFTDLSAGTIYDVSDNILTLGNHEATNNQDMRGIFASYHHTGSGTDKFGFFGLDPSFNGGVVDDTQGQFLFQTDASFNNSHVPNIFQGEPGRACFGTLDISGSTRYGGGGSSGVPTQDVSGQSGSSMHLVGKTIIARQSSNTATAQLDISGGLNVEGDICGNEATIGTGRFGIDYSTVDIVGGLGGVIVNSTSAVDITGANSILINTTSGVLDLESVGGIVDINGGTGVIITAITNDIDISANTNVKIGVGTTFGQILIQDGSGAYIDMSGGIIDISGDHVNITGGPTSISLKSQTINIGEPGGTVNYEGTINVSDISAVNDITITSTAGDVDIIAQADINISATVGDVLITGVDSSVVGTANAGANIGLWGSSHASEGVTIDGSNGVVDITAVGAITITSTTGNIDISANANCSITGDTLNINTAGNIDISANANCSITGDTLNINTAGIAAISSSTNIINLNGPVLVGCGETSSGITPNYPGLIFNNFAHFKDQGGSMTPANFSINAAELIEGYYIEAKTSTGLTNNWNIISLPTSASIVTALLSTGLTILRGMSFTPIIIVQGTAGGNVNQIEIGDIGANNLLFKDQTATVGPSTPTTFDKACFRLTYIYNAAGNGFNIVTNQIL